MSVLAEVLTDLAHRADVLDALMASCRERTFERDRVIADVSARAWTAADSAVAKPRPALVVDAKPVLTLASDHH